MRILAVTILAVAVTGCIDGDEPSKSFFRTPAPPGPLPAMTPASTESAARVDAVGRRLLAANPQIGAQPMFRTIGSPQPEVFHRGTTDVFITEGLVQQCTTDGQLAAALAVELGKMVRAREANVPDKLRTRDPQPPMDNRHGPDDRMGGITDRNDLREMQQYEKERKARRAPAPLPDPNTLARDYVTKAGFPSLEVDVAQTALKAAAGNTLLERQITSR